MNKIVNPAICDCGKTRRRAFARITIEDGNLRITGVIGPTRGGNALGYAGQCQDHIRAGDPAEGWDREMLDKFCDIWDRWHLNNSRAACEHQRQLGWERDANEEATIYHWRLNEDVNREKDRAEAAALAALRAGDTFTPTSEEAFYANLVYGIETYNSGLPDEMAPYYHPKRSLYPGDIGASEKKKRGWIRYGTNPIGILCKPCPVCGYEYGSKWMKEDVPADVIQWLITLPGTKVKPAWV